MRTKLAVPLAALGVALMLATGASAQTQPPDTAAVGTSVTIVPATPNGAPAAAFVQSYAYQPVCEVRREQFVDQYGWRVRNILVCR